MPPAKYAVPVVILTSVPLVLPTMLSACWPCVCTDCDTLATTTPPATLKLTLFELENVTLDAAGNVALACSVEPFSVKLTLLAFEKLSDV